MTASQLFLQQLSNGLTLGSIYALIALGYTMIYGVIQLINFAHGEVFIVGAYAALCVMSMTSLQAVMPWWLLLGLAIVVAMFVSALLGWVMERLAYRPLRTAPRLNALITAIGMSFFLQNALMLIFGATDRSFPNWVPAVRWDIGGVTLTLMHIIIWVSSALMMLGLHFLVMKTQLGMAMRATSQDQKACYLLGIPVNRIISMTFMIGAVFASVGGVLFGLNYGTINFHDGYMMGLKAFTAAVLGGIGNLPGAMIGGLVLGILESMGAGYLSSQWKNVFAFVILVIILIFKPRGLLGERVAERA